MTDALTDILQSIHMKGSVFSRAALSAPWGVESGTMSTGIFHAVVRGRAWACLEAGGDPVELERGDVVLMPFGDNHLMTHSPGAPTRPIGEATFTDERGMGHLVVNGGGAETSLICGSVAFDNGEAHPIFTALPRLIRVRDIDGTLTSVVETLIRLIADEIDTPEPGAETVVARLTDVLVVYMLRNYINSLEPGQGGWLAGLTDPGIRTALGMVHRNPERSWTAAQLAAAAGMSRSAFFARFKELVGETPTEYLTRWRVHLASRLLREEDFTVAGAARRVGYSTEAAFSNAFHRVMGVRPGAYRRAA